uniref:Uncharacterized protein n=1 Tax=Oryza sativa subsp. japonica TaxID=39947 RepID=Q6Z5Y7_ORYSJ|nr:hypothetical protein [Oryza sativa Japonica Group]
MMKDKVETTFMNIACLIYTHYTGSFRQIGRADPDKSRQTGKRLMTTHARGHGCDDDGAKGLGFGGARRSALYASLSPVAIHEITTPSGGSELVAAAERSRRWRVL